MDQTITHQLEYAPPAKRRIFTKRRFIWLAFGLLSMVAIYFAWREDIPAIRARFVTARLRSAALQACLAHTMATTQPAFDELSPKPASGFHPPNSDRALFRVTRVDIPVRYDQLPPHPNYSNYGWGASSPTPSCWPHFLDSNFLPGELRRSIRNQYRFGLALHLDHIDDDYRTARDCDPDGVFLDLLYLGPVTTPSGQQRLIHLSFDGPAFVWGGKRPFRVVSYPTHWSLRTYTPVESDSSAGLDFSDLRPFKIFPAQRDAQDPSHLTVAYQFGPDTGTIDARLDNAGRLTLSRRP